MLELKLASIIINYFNSKNNFKTSEMWIEWRETVLSIYEDKFQSGEINANVNSGKVLSKKIKKADDIVDFLSEKPNESELFSLLELYKMIVENNESYIPDTFNHILWDEILNLVLKVKEIQETTTQEWFKKRKENNFKTIIFVPTSLRPVLFDFILRMISVWFYNTIDLSFFMDNESIFVISQFVVIPIIIVVYAILRDKIIAKNTNKILAKTGKTGISLKTKNSAWNYLLIVILAIVGSFVPIKLDNINFAFGIYPILIFFYGLYLMIILINFSKSYPKYQHIVEQLDLKEHRELNHNLSPEKNDEEIINLEVNLKSENERMDAYVIEAALFGALAFSGFVQLISVGDLTTDYMTQFHHHIQVLMSYLINSHVNDFDLTLKFLFSKEGLIIFLSYQTLLCSVFFLSVIASRLRYSKLTDAVNRSLELAKSYNKKEDDHLKENSEKYKYYNEKIKSLLKKGYKKQDEIEPIMSFMKFFRTLGIGMFFLILVFSGIFISKWFALILLGVSIISIVYFKLSLVRKGLKHLYIAMQEFYFRFNKLINWSCWSIIVISILMRSLGVEIANIFLFFGFSFLFLHYLLRLVIPIQFDYDVKRENDAFNSYINFQKILTVIFNISLALFFLGFMFKAQHWPFAGILVIVSLFIMSFYFLFVKKTYQKSVILQLVLSISIFVCLIGVMFRFQHWNGAAFFNYSTPFLTVISLILTIIYRKNIRKSIQRTVYILFVLSMLFFSDYLRYSFSSMNFNYTHYVNSTKLDAIESKIYRNFDKMVDLLNSKENSIENGKKIKQLAYNLDYLLPKIDFDFHDLGFIAEQIIESPQKNDFILSKAESWMESYISKYPYWQFRNSYAKVLLENKKYDKALQQAILAKKEVTNKENSLLVKKIKRAQESESTNHK